MSARANIEAPARGILVRKRTRRQVGRVSGERRGIAAVSPHLDGFKNGETNHLQPTLLELGHLRISTSINDDISENAVSLKIVEGNDHAPAG